MSAPLLEVQDLHKHFPVGKKGLLGAPAQWLHAVDGVTFDVGRGETVGLVGESGCGKSTLRTHGAVGLLPDPTEGKRGLRRHRDISEHERRSALRPIPPADADDLPGPVRVASTRAMTVGFHPRRAAHDLQSGQDLQATASCARCNQLLDKVGLNPSDSVRRYPHEFSGGQRQRIGIARALAVEPKISSSATSPISALDVSIQAQIDQPAPGSAGHVPRTSPTCSSPTTSHVVQYICDRVAVMYLGKVVEFAERDELFENPQHPYTKALLSAVPHPDPKIERTRERIVLEGDVPSPLDPPPGCRFHPRCPERHRVEGDLCETVEPELGERSACHLTGT